MFSSDVSDRCLKLRAEFAWIAVAAAMLILAGIGWVDGQKMRFDTLKRLVFLEGLYYTYLNVW
jgi:hypothetical protein